jgi:hypothetical protein
MGTTEYKFIVVPLGEFFSTEFGIWLNTFYRTNGAEAHFKKGNVPKNGFYVPHAILTSIKRRIPEWKEHFEFYEERGNRRVRKYSIPDKKADAKKKQAKEFAKKAKEKKAEKATENSEKS